MVGGRHDDMKRGWKSHQIGVGLRGNGLQLCTYKYAVSVITWV
jgi:hypothetical protein